MASASGCSSRSLRSSAVRHRSPSASRVLTWSEIRVAPWAMVSWSSRLIAASVCSCSPSALAERAHVYAQARLVDHAPRAFACSGKPSSSNGSS
ncbi:hypothetical protein GXW82_21955 [Streptacidiphilus sp. 4-A2]|nr:hypothetical protein [Streptacidiphilus sp. 4-A2]